MPGGGAASQDPRWPAVAWNGTAFLVAWEAEGNIMAARVTPAGALLDPAGIVVSSAANEQAAPSVASDGSGFLVAWEDFRSGPTYQIYGARLAGNGSVLDPSGIRISRSADDHSSPAVSWNGARYLVAWEERKTASNWDVYAARISQAGALEDVADISVTGDAGIQSKPAVASAGGNFVIAWASANVATGEDIRAARVAGSGAVLDAAGITVSNAPNDQTRPSIAAAASTYLVAWTDERADAGGDVFAARVSADGVVADAGGIPIATGTAVQDGGAVGSAGGGFLVGWYDHGTGARGDVRAARVSQLGLVEDATPIAVASSSVNLSRSIAVAGAADAYLAIWIGDCVEAPTLCGARISTDGAVADPGGFGISRTAGDQVTPAIARGASNYLAVWREGTPSGGALRGTRLAPNGAVLDTGGIGIGGNGYLPAIAWGGGSFLVAWSESRGDHHELFAVRVSPAGAVLDDPAIALTPGRSARDPAIAWDGTSFVVAANGGSGVTATRVSPAGQTLDPAGIQIEVGGRWDGPQIASDGAAASLIVWSRDVEGGLRRYEVMGARVAASGTLLDDEPLAIAHWDEAQLYPSVTFDGSNYVVAWEDERAYSSRDIYAARVAPSGALLDPHGLAVSVTGSSEGEPRIAGYGPYSLALWREDIGGARALRAARIGPGGGITDPLGVLVADDVTVYEYGYGLAGGADGAAAVYVRRVGGADRVFVRTLAEPASSAPRALAAAPRDAQVALDWVPPSSGSPAGYRVYRGTSAGGLASYATVGAVTSFTDTAAANGTTYWYAVAALTPSGEGPRSEPATATPFTLPGPPANGHGIPGPSSFTLDWDPPANDGGADVAAYYIYVGTQPGGAKTLVYKTFGTSLTENNMDPGTTLYYEISAQNAAGEGPRAAEIAVTPGQPIDAPSAPRNLRGTLSGTRITLAWDVPTDDGGGALIGYRVYRDTGSGSPSLHAELGTTRAFEDPGLAGGVTYRYTVSAFNQTGEGPRSNEVSFAVTTAPAPPADLQATPGDGSVNISWSVPGSNGGTAVTGYRVYRAVGGATAILLAQPTLQGYLDNQVANGTTYRYEISAVNSVGEGPRAIAYVTPLAAPGPPVDLRAAPGSALGDIELAWAPPSAPGGAAIIGYRIYRASSPNSAGTFVRQVTGTTFVDHDRSALANVYYHVRAFNGVEGPAPAVACARPFPWPAVVGCI